MKKKLWATLVAFIALMVFATSAFAAARWRNVALLLFKKNEKSFQKE